MSEPTLNLSMIAGEDGRPVLHAVNCPQVQAARERGEPVFTMFNCEKTPSDDMAKHTCLDPADPARSAAK
jgi:hypothetical protein